MGAGTLELSSSSSDPSSMVSAKEAESSRECELPKDWRRRFSVMAARSWLRVNGLEPLLEDEVEDDESVRAWED